jgi:hypothetical protein
MPRKSSAALSVVPLPPLQHRIRPPTDLAPPEATAFRTLVAQCSPDHFTESDTPLLISFVQATLIGRAAATALASGQADALARWERATKLQATLATRLRLAPQARASPITAGRKQQAHRRSIYNEMTDEEDS